MPPHKKPCDEKLQYGFCKPQKNKTALRPSGRVGIQWQASAQREDEPDPLGHHDDQGTLPHFLLAAGGRADRQAGWPVDRCCVCTTDRPPASQRPKKQPTCLPLRHELTAHTPIHTPTCQQRPNPPRRHTAPPPTTAVPPVQPLCQEGGGGQPVCQTRPPSTERASRREWSGLAGLVRQPTIHCAEPALVHFLTLCYAGISPSLPSLHPSIPPSITATLPPQQNNNTPSQSHLPALSGQVRSVTGTQVSERHMLCVAAPVRPPHRIAPTDPADARTQASKWALQTNSQLASRARSRPADQQTSRPILASIQSPAVPHYQRPQLSSPRRATTRQDAANAPCARAAKAVTSSRPLSLTGKRNCTSLALRAFPSPFSIKDINDAHPASADDLTRSSGRPRQCG
ncbi:hypothetical protein BKA81DRAFT_395598 [Phyllosticta paracitricarpa]|uniref:Uncharacterized protein n=1 Tax=Phyllosticta citricarpa TaxID=55181 RepID=A0ABR1MGS6_9PEZI